MSKAKGDCFGGCWVWCEGVENFSALDIITLRTRDAINIIFYSKGCTIIVSIFKWLKLSTLPPLAAAESCRPCCIYTHVRTMCHNNFCFIDLNRMVMGENNLKHAWLVTPLCLLLFPVSSDHLIWSLCYAIGWCSQLTFCILEVKCSVDPSVVPAVDPGGMLPVWMPLTLPVTF